MNEELKSNLLSKKHWSRLVFMLLVSMVLYIAFFVTWFVIVAQFTFALITGNDNDNLRRLGGSLALFIRQCVSFLTYSNNIKPFPFSDWPQAENVDSTEANIQAESADSTEVNTQAESADSTEVNTTDKKMDENIDEAEQEESVDVVETAEAQSSQSINKHGIDKNGIDKNEIDKK